MVSIWQLALAAVFVAALGLAAGAAQAGERVVLAGGGGGSWSFTIRQGAGSHWHDSGFPNWRHKHRRRDPWPRPRRHHRRYKSWNQGRVVFVDPWYRPWRELPRTAVIERPVSVPAPVPTRATVRPDAYCREFQKQIIIDGQVEPAYGVACRQPDGSWKLQP
jgi:hypothetical protein